MLTTEYVKQTLVDYFENQPVAEVYLFGSFARDEQREGSDIDVLVCVSKEYQGTYLFYNWHEDLKFIFNCEIDLISSLPIKFIGRNYSFRKTMERSKLLVYSRKDSLE